MFGPPMKAVLVACSNPVQTLTLAASSGRMMVPTSVSGLERAKFRFGTLLRDRRFAACLATTPESASWAGASIYFPLVPEAASSTTTTSALLSTRSLSSSRTHRKSVGLSGDQTAPSLLLAATTTWFRSGMPVLCPFPSLPRPTTRLPSRLSPGALGT